MGTLFGTMEGIVKRLDALQKQKDELLDRLLQQRDELKRRALAEGISLEQIERLFKTDSEGETNQNKEVVKNDS